MTKVFIVYNIMLFSVVNVFTKILKKCSLATEHCAIIKRLVIDSQNKINESMEYTFLHVGHQH